jgi:hypothetical protein
MVRRTWIALAAMLIAGTARANGRFPASNGVMFAPGEPDLALVRVTFGLVITRDRGQSWKWICERAIGFSGPEDPSYVITKSGAIVAGLFDGLRVTRDGGCTWESVKTADAKVFVDVTARGDGAIVALASSYDRHSDGGSLYKSQLWLSTDDAKTFAPMGARMDPTLLAETVEVAPSDPSRVYVSAVRGDDVGRQGVLLVSTDSGAHWVQRKMSLEPKELAPFIAAVDAMHAERIYLRTSASPENATRLLVTDDAGKTYRQLLGAKGPLLGFALSPDGATVHAGGPDDGLFAGAADATELSPVSKLKVQCLARAGDVLWACSSEAGGFIAGTAKLGDASTASAPVFEARLHLRSIGGPIVCPAGSAVTKECGTDWVKLMNDIGLGGGKSIKAEEAQARVEESVQTRDRGVWWAAVVAIIGAAVLLVRARRRRE